MTDIKVIAEARPGVSGLSGGPKQKWLREHRQEVMSYYNEHDPDATMKRYNIRPMTLDNFLREKQIHQDKLSKADKAVIRAEIVEQGLREVRHEVAEMKKQYEEFVPLIANQLTDKFFIPLLSLGR